MSISSIVNWLLKGDVSIKYQVYKDLLDIDSKELQDKIALQGWGKDFLDKRKSDGHWGEKFYQPKWTSTHYTLLDLRNLNLSPGHPQILESIHKIIENERGIDGGINPVGSTRYSDVCINGMFLNYACFFGIEEKYLTKIIDFILSQRMADGGFNCQSNRAKPVHSSLHTTLSVLEGINEYENRKYGYRMSDLLDAKKTSIEFILSHHLFKSDRTGKIIHPDFLRFSYPGRWKYDILRCLDFFRKASVAWDQRMQAAMDYLLEKRNANGTWNLRAHHPGKRHFDMEQAGKPSRWNTLRALRIIKFYKPDHIDFSNLPNHA